jgi:ABC-2 type transport system ATP-binding protein
MNVIETQNLTKIYKNKHIALNGVNLTVPQGSVYGLVGPNGAGKTVAIRLLLGLQNPTAGSIEVLGEKMGPNAVHLRRRIGFLPTNPKFPKDMNPIQYLDFVGKLFGLPSETRRPRLAGLLRAMDLLSASSQKIGDFSTGMVTRLGIAASLMNDPELLIWDEPTAGLDPEGRKYTTELIKELGQSKTIIVSSHDLNEIKKICDHLGIISEGKLIFSGPVQDLNQLTPSTTIELELAGDMESLCKTLSAKLDDDQWERSSSVLKLFFNERDTVPAELAKVLNMVAKTNLRLVAVNSQHDEMVDIFIRLLKEERSHGFSRNFRNNSEGNGISGNS